MISVIGTVVTGIAGMIGGTPTRGNYARERGFARPVAAGPNWMTTSRPLLLKRRS